MSSRRDKYSMLKDEGKLHGTVARARKLRKVRDRRHTQNFLRYLDRPSRIIIPLGVNHIAAMRTTARRLHPRRKRWERPAPNVDIMSKAVGIVTIGLGRYSSKCKYQKVDYQPSTRSFAVLTRKKMCWYIATNHEIWTAPKGWHFGTDCRPGCANLRLYVCRDSYATNVDFRWYFDSDDVYRGETAFWALARRRIRAIQREKQDKREYARITSTVITVELLVPHNGEQTIIRIQRTGPMRMRYARDYVR